MKIGYPCQNLTLPTRFRTCRLQTMEQEGMAKIKELTLMNIQMLQEVLRWNIEHDILFFRISSDMIPFATHPKMTWVWQDDEDVKRELEVIKQLQKKHQLRLSMHPGQYTILNSPKAQVVRNAIKDLTYHAEFLEHIGGSDMILHTGGAYGDKASAKEAFVNTYKTLSPSIRALLRLENDDKTFHTEDVLEIHDMCGVPICFDLHHELCFDREIHEVEKLVKKVLKTWSDLPYRPKMHLSSGKNAKNDRAHADYIKKEDYERLLMILGDHEVDIMLEAKAKEKALFKLLEETSEQSR
ncbi:UV DNA damage repair endonuclease UvsE [Bacillus sp. FJAT-45037]|uniref:UV DNA damage repair endonuclease UvsE n=1 Tax=Bacillus sp. FJAT-45037 TaxID=2011007 RepID=UPI000C2321EF|nr:UV DNA damage repair endonuclease UvsE [Bacillus sp. FJAT-45037]